MATWTALDNASWFGAVFACDMGPYVGPDTFSVDYLPADCDELDFYIAAGSDAAALFSGVGDVGAVADAYRYVTPDGSRSRTDSLSNRGVSSDGAHLFVVWYPLGPGPMSTPPALKPEQVVPCTYVRGGRGPYFGPGVTTPGQWSDWQPGYVTATGNVPAPIEATHPFFNASLDTNAGVNDPANAPYEGTQYRHPPTPLPLPDRDLVELGAESLARQRAGTEAGDLFGNRGGITQVFGWKQYRIGSDSYPYTPTDQIHWFEAFTRITQMGLAFTRPDGGGLGRPNGAPGDYEWEGGPTGTVHLPDRTADVSNRGGYDQPGSQNFQSGTPLEHTATETFEIWAIPGTGPNADAVRVDPSATGIKLVDFELSTHLHADGSVSYDPPQSLTIPYSMIPSSWAQFTLIYQPRLFHDGDGASLWYDIPTPDPTGPDNGSFRAYQYGIVPDGWLQASPTYEIHTPRWRSYIPETYTPGPLRCCPGQTLRITPRAGGHWSDWQDGLTVTRGNGSGFAARANNRSSSWAAWDGNVEFPPLAGDQASFDTFLARLIAGGQSPLSQFSLSGYVGLASWAWSQVRQQRAGLGDAHYVQNMYVTVGGVNLQLDPAAASFPFAGVSTPTPGGAGAPPGPLVNDGIQWESGTATAHLADLTLTDRKLVIYSQDYDFSSTVFYTAGGTQGHNFTPPSTVPLIIAIGPAIDAAQGLPRLADYTVLARVDAPATIGGPHAPYSTLGFPNDGSQYPTQPAAPFDVTIPLSMASVPSGPFSLAVFPGYLEPGRTPWTVPSIANFEAQDFQVLLESATDFNFFDGGQNIDVTYTTPRWRYWIPGGSGNDYECIAQAAFWGIRMAP